MYPFLRPFNQNKLQPRSTQCIFLGYLVGYKGVVCYNMQAGKLIVPRHVIHDESIFPGRKMYIPVEDDIVVLQKSRPTPILVQLPISNATDQVSIPEHESSQESQSVSVSEEQSQSRTVNSGSSMTDSASCEIPHHHHSIPISSSSPLLPVHQNSQL